MGLRRAVDRSSLMTATGPTSRLARTYIGHSRGPPSRSVLPNPCGKSARPTGQDIAVATPVTNAGLPLDNQLLASLPRDHFDRLLPHLSTVSLQQGGAVRSRRRSRSDLLSRITACCRCSPCCATARRSRPPPSAAKAWSARWPGSASTNRWCASWCRCRWRCSRIAATHFRTVAAASEPVRNLCIRYNEVLLSQARVTAACNALHPIEARFCRWLLQSADRAASDTVALTQEFLAEMLGVRRTSVTEVASKVQSAGAITYSRGVIKILDRPGADADVLRVLRNAAGPIRRAGLTALHEPSPQPTTCDCKLHGRAIVPASRGDQAACARSSSRRCRSWCAALPGPTVPCGGALRRIVLRTLPHGSEDVLASGIFLQRFPVGLVLDLVGFLLLRGLGGQCPVSD